MSRAIPLGRYTLGERLGVGGMGEVYLATASGLGGFEKPLALKLLLPHLAEKPGLVDRFLQEAQLAAKMNHVNVAQIFDVGNAGNRYFIAMELVRGVALSTLIKSLEERGGSVSPALAAYVGRAVCDGLHHAHGLNVVHRDVTPHNILVSVDGAVKLTDFGIARAGGTSEEQRRMFGKPAYVAPEIVQGGEVDRRADIFSLGVSLFQLATLTSPFKRQTDADTLDAIVKDPLPAAPPELAAALARACAKAPGERFDDARQLRDALPPPPMDAADQLSRLVLSVCAKDIDKLDAQTRQLVTLRPGTVALPRPRSKWPLVLAVPLIGGIAATYFWPRETPAPLSPPPPVVVAAAPEPEPEPAVELAPAPAPHHKVHPAPPTTKFARTGYISIDAKPWAEVRVDGKLIGETPIASFPVDANGKAHEVELRNPDTNKQMKRSVRVAEGQRAFVQADLQ